MQEIKEKLLQAIEAAKSAKSADALEKVRIDFLGRKGMITTLAKNVDFSKMSVEEKKSFGSRLNELKNLATESLAAANAAILESAPRRKANDLDLTAPGKGRRFGALHPITLAQMELEDIFQGMGFSVLYGP